MIKSKIESFTIISKNKTTNSILNNLNCSSEQINIRFGIDIDFSFDSIDCCCCDGKIFSDKGLPFESINLMNIIGALCFNCTSLANCQHRIEVVVIKSVPAFVPTQNDGQS
ncbi:hypothetical protein DERP_007480 [Dermatophagoides pteronyssinus]|uniref:Uncharacterized protein n=1 Tax=Dermatophagoides pteronyssinus TaxID=6956 RepID=A0ABQ8J4Q1_DERPT|nr:hypothetical protein DERP_007480 [Dermatophagoides pteronyssinus]